LLKQKKILVGISGSIAAYKAAILVRSLVKVGAEVQVIMTSSAKTFITPLTLSTLSKNPVLSEFSKDEGTGEWNNHVSLGLWADLMVVAPSTAHTLAKFAHGICNDLLTATYLSARCPVYLAPAMDLDMYQHPTTQDNLKKLQAYGNRIIAAEHGELASGLVGIGRMAEPEQILQQIVMHFSTSEVLSGKKVLITAGPTHETIDPVRYISNASTGKMGYAIARRMAEMGAKVMLVSGPTDLSINHPNIEVFKVNSAQQMYEACMHHFPDCNIAVMAAAVSDYTPKQPSEQKIKKTNEGLNLHLVKTKDIAASLGKIKKSSQLMVGFALETQNEEQNAIEKLHSKNLDLIVLNSLNDKGAGFAHDTNKVKIINRTDNHIREFALKNKQEVAQDIIDAIIAHIHA
jgi:phosphopantothenoylcysteine decarboxylase / phosphopantothenate---cysteine ligase